MQEGGSPDSSATTPPCWFIGKNWFQMQWFRCGHPMLRPGQLMVGIKYDGKTLGSHTAGMYMSRRQHGETKVKTMGYIDPDPGFPHLKTGKWEFH